MANRRDGGFVVMGVADSDGVPDPVGLSGEDLETWKQDDIASKLAEYTDPSVSFESENPVLRALPLEYLEPFTN